MITDIVFTFKEVKETHAYIIFHGTCFKKIQY